MHRFEVIWPCILLLYAWYLVGWQVLLSRFAGPKRFFYIFLCKESTIIDENMDKNTMNQVLFTFNIADIASFKLGQTSNYNTIKQEHWFCSLVYESYGSATT